MARSLTEWDDAFPDGRDIRVHRTALVGTVNNGTILADVHHWRELVDTLSTVLNTVGINLPAPAALILSFVKDIAEAAYPSLAGLECMVPYGWFLTKFNARGPRLSEYLAIASNYEPTDGRVRSYVTDAVRDLIFDRHDNDAMVRIDSVIGSTEPGGFPADPPDPDPGRDQGHRALALLREPRRGRQARQLARRRAAVIAPARGPR